MLLVINNDNLAISSSMSGISFYSYEQRGVATDYTSGKGTCNFAVYGKFYLILSKYLLNIGANSTATGNANLITNTGVYQ